MNYVKLFTYVFHYSHIHVHFKHFEKSEFFYFFLSFDGQCLHCVCDTTNLRVLIITRRRVRKRRPLRYHSIHGIGLPSTRHDNVILCLAIISKRSLLLCAIRAGLAIIIIIMKESRKKTKIID